MLNAILISMVVWASPMLDAPYGMGKLPDDINAQPKSFDSLNVRLVSALPFGHSHTVTVGDDNIVFVNSGFGVLVFDVSDPSNPRKISSILTRGAVNSLFYLNNMLYIANADFGLRIIDVSDPYNPQEVGHSLACPANDVFVSSNDSAALGNYAYVANGHWGLRIIDVSDPYNPQIISSYRTYGSASRVFVEGNYAYIAEEGLEIVDVSDPSNPHRVSYTSFDFWIKYIFGRGDYAYVNCIEYDPNNASL